MVIIRHEYPSLEGLDISFYALIDLIFTEVFDLNTAAVSISKSIAVSGIVTKSRLAHFGHIVSRNKSGRSTAPGLIDILILGDLSRCSYIIEHSNRIDQTLEISGVGRAVISTYSEGVGVFSRLRNSQACGISCSLVHAVHVEANTGPAGGYGNGIMMYSTDSDIGLGLIEGSLPFRAAVVLTAYDYFTVIDRLNIDVSRSVFAIVTYNYATVSRTCDMRSSCKLELEGHR